MRQTARVRYNARVTSSDLRAFPVALNLDARAVLVLGGGQEAIEKVPRLVAAGARVTLIAEQIDEALAREVRARRLVWFARAFEPTDTAGVHLVMLTEIDPVLGARLRTLARREGFLLCAIDQPALSDLFLVSVVEQGPVQIGISTSGRAPLLARRIRQALERGLDARFGEFARRFAALRARVRTLPKTERSEVLGRALEGFAMEVRVRYPEPDGQGAGYPPDEVCDE